jgi:hypothetical protein
MLSSLLPRLALFRDSSIARFWSIVMVERITVTVLASLICDLAGAGPRLDLDRLDSGQLVFFGVLVAPLLETLVLQAFPYEVACACGFGVALTLGMCWLPFAFLHLSSGMSAFVCAGLCSGYYLSQTYVRLRRRSFIAAYWLTAASHAVLNSIAAVGLVYQRGW